MDGPSCRCGELRLNAEPNRDREGLSSGEPFDEGSTRSSPRVDGWASTGFAAVATGADSGVRCRVVGLSGHVPTSGASFAPSPVAREAHNSAPPRVGADHSSPSPRTGAVHNSPPLLAGEGRVGALVGEADDSPSPPVEEGTVGALRLR